MKEFTCLCTSTKAFKSGFVKFCSYKKDLDLLRNLHAYVHACNGTKLLKSGFVKFCSDKKRTLFSICTYATKLFKSDLVKFCSNKKKSDNSQNNKDSPSKFESESLYKSFQTWKSLESLMASLTQSNVYALCSYKNKPWLSWILGENSKND